MNFSILKIFQKNSYRVVTFGCDNPTPTFSVFYDTSLKRIYAEFDENLADFFNMIRVKKKPVYLASKICMYFFDQSIFIFLF